jgi:hypothetical protein
MIKITKIESEVSCTLHLKPVLHFYVNRMTNRSRFRVRNSTIAGQKKTHIAKIVNQSLQRQTLLPVSKSMRKKWV